MKKIVLLIFCISLSAITQANSCAEFEAEAEAFEGVVPKFDENRQLRALLMYGEATFLTPKRSLINEARRKAELNAKRAYAEFLKSDFDSETLSASLIETAQQTDQDGNTAGLATELSSTLERMRSSSSAVLSGIVKLDECVNTEEKYVLVALGWKPSLSKAAADSKVTMTAQKGRDLSTKKSTNNKANGSSKVAAPSKSNNISNIEIISVESEGFGGTLDQATNNALTRAVSQVFGEKFASNSNVVESLNSISATTSSGKSAGLAIEQSSSKNEVSSSTKGIISSWEYVSKNTTDDGYQVILLVSMPKYQSSLEGKTKIVISSAQLNDTSLQNTQLFNEFSSLLTAELEQQLGGTDSLAVLDRQNASILNRELSQISQQGNIAEVAKLGNKAGADIILIPVFDKFEHSVESRQLGETVIERTVFNISFSLRVIEVATSNLIDAKKFTIKNKKIKSSSPEENIAQFITKRSSTHLFKVLGATKKGNNLSEHQGTQNFEEVKKLQDKQYEDLEKDVENDW